MLALLRIILGTILMLLGLLGMVMPIIPGIPLIILAVLLVPAYLLLFEWMLNFVDHWLPRLRFATRPARSLVNKLKERQQRHREERQQARDSLHK